MNKKIEVEKVEINKINLWMKIIGIGLCLIIGILILCLTDSQDRLQLAGWMFIGFAGFKIAMEIDYTKKTKKKKSKKVDGKKVSKLAIKITLIMFLTQLINVALCLFLLYSEIPNFMFFLIYIPSSIGLTIFTVALFFIIFMYENHYNLHKIINKFKKKELKGGKRKDGRKR